MGRRRHDPCPSWARPCRASPLSSWARACGLAQTPWLGARRSLVRSSLRTPFPARRAAPRPGSHMKPGLGGCRLRCHTTRCSPRADNRAPATLRILLITGSLSQRVETATSQGQRGASECPQRSRPASRRLGAFLPSHPLWGRWGPSRRRSSVCGWGSGAPSSLRGAGFRGAGREDQQLLQGPVGNHPACPRRRTRGFRRSSELSPCRDTAKKGKPPQTRQALGQSRRQAPLEHRLRYRLP